MSLLSIAAEAGADDPAAKAAAVGALKRDFPQVAILDDEHGHLRCAFGVKMNQAQSPKDAALAWVSEYGEASCGQMLDVSVRQTMPCGEGKVAVHLLY